MQSSYIKMKTKKQNKQNKTKPKQNPEKIKKKKKAKKQVIVVRRLLVFFTYFFIPPLLNRFAFKTKTKPI